MTDYQTFEGAVEPMPWGDAVYTILRVPDEVVASLGKTRRVEGEIHEHPVNLALSKAPVIDGVFLWAGKSLLDRIGIQPGEVVEVRLRPTDEGIVETPEDVAMALRTAGQTQSWEALTPGKRRSLLYHIETAKRDQTRAKRITKMISELE